jgi:hypothetical protein
VHEKRSADTKIWLGASLVIPTHHFKARDKTNPSSEILQVCNEGHLVIVSRYNFTELHSSYHANIDLDLFPESWIHTECVHAFDKENNDGPYAVRRYSSYKQTKVWTSTNLSENPFQLIWMLGFLSIIMYSILLLFCTQGKSFEEGDATGGEGANRRWARNKQNGRLDKV